MLFLDSADRQKLEPLLATGLFAGVTTNPTILSRAGLSQQHLPDLYAWCVRHGVQHFFAQAVGSSVDNLRRSAERILGLDERIVVKLACTLEGLTVAKGLTAAGRRVLVTAVYHPSQIALAGAAGAEFVAPYVARASQAGYDGIRLVQQLAQVRHDRELPRILAASLRSADHVAEAFAAGADDVTVADTVAYAVLNNELTLQATAEFEHAANAAMRAKTDFDVTQEAGAI